jgi:hypothetical protein
MNTFLCIIGWNVSENRQLVSAKIVPKSKHWPQNIWPCNRFHCLHAPFYWTVFSSYYIPRSLPGAFCVSFICSLRVLLGPRNAAVSAGLPDGIFSNQKNPLWVNFGGSCNGRCWYILCPFGVYYGHSEYIFPYFVFCTKKNLATLCSTSNQNSHHLSKILKLTIC